MKYQQAELLLERFDVTIPVVIDNDDGTVYVPCRFLCENVLGVSWGTQHGVLTNPEQRFHKYLREVPITIRKRYPRSPLGLPADEAALWIGNINPVRVGNQARDALTAFQDELRAEAQRLLWRTRRARTSSAGPLAPYAANITSASASATSTSSVVRRAGEVRYTFTCSECGTTHTLVETEEGTAYLIHGE